MPDARQVIELLFEGVDNTAAATQSAIRNTEQFAGSVQSATQPIADFTAGALRLEAGLLAAGVAVTAFSISLASDFQSAASDLQKVLSETDDIENYKNLALELSEVYGVASVDILNSITNYAQAGFAAKEAGELTKAGLDLVIAGNVEAARSSNLLVASIKGFGAEAGDSAELVDLLNAVSNQYAANVEQLLEGFSALSPVASAAGFSLQETVGILTPGIEVFQSGAEVANALKISLLSLQNDTPRVTGALAELGVAQRDANGELRSARDIYFDVAEALNGVSDTQRGYLAGQLVLNAQSARFLAITAGLDDTLRISGDSFDYLGSAAAEVALQLGTAESAVNRSQAALTNLFIAIGSPLLDEFSGVADAITGIFQAIGASADAGGIAELVEFIEGQLGSLQATLENIATNLPAALDAADLSGFIDGVRAVGSAVSVLFSSFDLSTIDGLARAITATGQAFNGLSQFTGGVIESFRPLFEQLTSIGGGLTQLNPELFAAAGNIAGFASQANLLAGSLNSLLPAVQGLVAVIGINQAVGLAGSLRLATGALGGAGGLITLLGGAAGLTAVAGTAGAIIGTALVPAVDALVDASTDTEESLGTWIYQLVNGKEEAERVAAAIASVPTAMEDVGAAADSAGEKVFNFSTGLFEIDDAANDSVGTIYDLSDAVEETAQALDEISSAGLGSGLESVSTGLERVADSAKQVGAAAEELQLEERLALIDAQSAITQTQITADAEKITAAYDTIGTAIEAISGNITSLYGLLGDESISKLDKLDIAAQIERENERLDEELALQKRLTEVQIAEINDRRRALQAGDPIITVNGDGLQPHLEAIMYSLLEAIQIRVNRDGYEMLLGAA